MMTRRALLMVNGNSRSGRAALDAIVEGLRRHDIEPVHVDCSAREDMSPLIVKHSGDVDMVLVAGGDGTLNSAAAGVLESKRPFGILPTGTANDLARTLGIPDNLDLAIGIIAAGKTRALDLGSVNDHLFFNVASIGLSSDLAHELTPDLKRRFGKLGYLIAALRVLTRAKPFRARIVSPTRQVNSFTLQVAVGNGRFYGGGNIVTHTADIADGTLDLYSLEFVKAWKIVLMFRSFRLGVHTARKEVRDLRSPEFEIFTYRPRSVNADGEIVTMTPAKFRVLPAAIEVFAPESTAVET